MASVDNLRGLVNQIQEAKHAREESREDAAQRLQAFADDVSPNLYVGIVKIRENDKLVDQTKVWLKLDNQEYFLGRIDGVPNNDVFAQELERLLVKMKDAFDYGTARPSGGSSNRQKASVSQML